MNKIRMNLDAWTYRDFVAFTEAYKGNDMRSCYTLARKILVSWDYAVPLDAENPIGKLSLADSAELLKTVMETLGNFIETLDIEPVKVSFAAWNTERFLAFNDARRNMNLGQIEKMVHEVATLEGMEPNEPLSFVDGTRVLRAIQEAYSRLLAGKN